MGYIKITIDDGEIVTVWRIYKAGDVTYVTKNNQIVATDIDGDVFKAAIRAIYGQIGKFLRELSEGDRI